MEDIISGAPTKMFLLPWSGAKSCNKCIAVSIFGKNKASWLETFFGIGMHASCETRWYEEWGANKKTRSNLKYIKKNEFLISQNRLRGNSKR